MADDGFDGGPTPEFLLDLAVDTALLPGAIDPVRLRRVVAAVALVDLDALDLAAGERLGFHDHVFQGVAVERIAGEGLGIEDELAPFAPFVGRGERDLDAELVGCPGLALADALGVFGACQE